MANGSRIEAELVAPDLVTIAPRRATVDVDVLCRLHNTGDDDYVVSAPSEDDAHCWHVLDRNHRDVTRPRSRRSRPPTKGVHPHRSRTIAGGHSRNTSKTLTLDAKKLKPGRTYTIRYEHYGHIAETQFTVLAKHSPPTRKKTTRPKKATKKTTSEKTSTAKKSKK